jgi:hypothetical protein
MVYSPPRKVSAVAPIGLLAEGSEDHKVLSQKGIWMDPDMNKYDVENVVTAHAKMSREELEGIYNEAWKIYYTPEHMKTILRRAGAFDAGVSHLVGLEIR